MQNNIVVAPDTDIYLLKVPFEMDNENELTFTDATAQYNYFSSLPKLELENATYQRKDGVLRWPGNFDDIITYNYCMYRNTAFSNKWFYAFIEDIKFENPNMTSIYLKTDVWETWQFNIVYKNMFVEREHVNNDTIGLHTIPEGLETGEYIINATSNISLSWQNIGFIVGVSKVQLLNNGAWQRTSAGNYFNTFSGLTYYGFLNTQTEIDDLINMLNYYDTEGQGESIETIFIVPERFINGYRIANPLTAPYDKYRLQKTNSTLNTFEQITRVQNIDTYIPKNNKLYVFPYQYLNLDNHAGNSYNYHYEDFHDYSTLGFNYPIEFEIVGTLTIGGSIFIIPSAYRTSTNKIEYGVPFPKYPVCNWVSDTYTNWLTQSAVNYAIGAGETLLGAGAMVFTGGVKGGNYLTSGISKIYDQLYQTYQHSFMPNETKGSLNSGDVLTADTRISPSFNQMTIKREYAKVIDDYFNAYGYKVNEYKIPNITGRLNWNYVKTINCNIVGDIPQKDLQELKEIFDNGVTLWHNPSTFLDYTQANTII